MSQAQVPTEVSRIFYHGRFWTNDPAQPQVEALAVVGERIVAAGPTEAIQKLAGLATEQYDLQGRRAVPGFNDAHVHFMSGGSYLLGIDLRPARTRQEFRRLVAEFAAQRPPGRWITGGDWDHEAWPDQTWPTRKLIDDVTREHPVLVNRLDGHLALANTLALRQAGIARDTPDPYGGTIVRDPETAEPTGILIDNAVNLVRRVIPEPTGEELLQAARAAQSHALSLGVTSLQDINASAEDLRAYQELRRRRELAVRLYVFRPIAERVHLGETGVQAAFGDAWLRIGGVKAFTDGSMGAGSALFYAPYNDAPETRGLALQPKAELERMILEADSLGLQVALHAIGDQANTWALDIFEAVRRKNGKGARRHRIEHAQVVLPQDLPRFAELGVIASIQPSHCIDDMRWAEKRIGDRIRHAYLFRAFVRHGARVALGTDWTVEPLDPMLGLYAAVTREYPEGGPAGGWFPDERLSLEEAVACYTLGSAYAEFTDHEKGRLAPGMLADFVVLDRDIFAIPPRELLQTRAVLTVVGGTVRYRREAP